MRREVYRQASLAGAYYGQRTQELSIRYNSSDNNSKEDYPTADLHFELLFMSVEGANRFIGALHNFFVDRHYGQLFEQEPLADLNPTPEFHNPAELALVMTNHYALTRKLDAEQHAFVFVFGANLPERNRGGLRLVECICSYHVYVRLFKRMFVKIEYIKSLYFDRI